ncbi:kinase-like domain-containing protein [Thermothelomyces heterothallicus CBS 202.75]|uniref:kinase-like domain-containing protein n=1 Tax=Thermothelomyces heterothallicus CBS 202.75 TaxID=1149848 RepID=UPI003744AB08
MSLRLINDDDANLYQLDKKLGSGGYGTVYRKLACKVQKVETDHQAGMRGRELVVWLEASRGTQHVARLRDASYNRETKLLFVYMDLLRGGDLYDFTYGILDKKDRHNIVHPFLVFHLACEVAFGLNEIHAKGIMHRDLKLDNVLLTHKLTPRMNTALCRLSCGEMLDTKDEKNIQELFDIVFRKSDRDDPLALLTDFGLSRNLNDENLRSNYTVVGMKPKWTKGISAPELVHHNHQSLMADIYSFGVLVYFYGHELQNLVHSCLNHDPLQRPDSEELIQKLWPLRIAAANRVKYHLKNLSNYKQHLQQIIE